MKKGLTLVFFCFGLLGVLAQVAKETNLIADGNELHQEEAYSKAEAEYRKALSINNINAKAQHNLGNALYRSKDFDQANQRYFETQKNSQTKEDKHLAFHNMGNGFMQQKMYEKAVEAYKNALRNNPTDEETRYNYALAKELLEKQKQEEAPSNLASIGRYILTSDIFDSIRTLPVGSGGEIQLADALNLHAQDGLLEAIHLKGKRFDCGSVDGFMSASAHIYAKRLKN